MNWIITGAAVIAALALVVLVVRPLWADSRRTVVRRRVLVNLKSGTAISGVVTKSTGVELIIRDGVLHQRDGVQSPADGELIVERADVDFIQAF